MTKFVSFLKEEHGASAAEYALILAIVGAGIAVAAIALGATYIKGTIAQETGNIPAVPVTVDNFVRAESHLYFNNSISGGGFGKFHHVRELLPIDHQTVIRGNRDTLYSAAVFDLDAGPVTIRLPDAGERFMSLQIIDEQPAS